MLYLADDQHRHEIVEWGDVDLFAGKTFDAMKGKGILEGLTRILQKASICTQRFDSLTPGALRLFSL